MHIFVQPRAVSFYAQNFCSIYALFMHIYAYFGAYFSHKNMHRKILYAYYYEKNMHIKFSGIDMLIRLHMHCNL